MQTLTAKANLAQYEWLCKDNNLISEMAAHLFGLIWLRGWKRTETFFLATETHWKNVPRKDDFAQSPFVLIEKLCSPNEPKAARFHSDWTIEEQTANSYRQNTFLRHKCSRKTWGPGGLENTGKQKMLICKRLPKSEPANKTTAIAICSCKLQNKTQKIQQGFCGC